MATWDASDVVARVKLYAGLPTNTEEMADADWYSLATEAEREWVGIMTQQYPNLMMGAPVLMSSEDSGKTYHLTSSATPLAIQVFDAPNGALLRPGAYWDADAGYVWEGVRIRMPKNATRTFADGPYARYVAQPTAALSATGTMTLLPDYARILVVYRTLAKWATIGGIRDPAVWDDRERKAWFGDGGADAGILGTLKMSNPFAGAAAYSYSENLTGLEYLRTVAGYTAI